MNKIIEKFRKILCKENYELDDSSNLTLELCFLDPRKGKLPIKKMVELAKSAENGIEIEKWWQNSNGEFTIEEAIPFFSNLSQNDFRNSSHYLYKGEDFSSVDHLCFTSVAPFIIPGTYKILWRGKIENLKLNAFEYLFTDPEFVCAYCYSSVDNFIQNETSTQWYEMKSIPFDKNRVIKSNDKYTPDGIDITGNPGRSRQVQNMELRSCWRMWFSENYYKVIPKEKTESFKGARVNEIQENGLRYIELYESPFDAAKPENRAIQKKFNEWIDIEGVYKEQVEKYGARI